MNENEIVRLATDVESFQYYSDEKYFSFNWSLKKVRAIKSDYSPFTDPLIMFSLLMVIYNKFRYFLSSRMSRNAHVRFRRRSYLSNRVVDSLIAVIREMQALSGFIGRKAFVDG